MNWLNEYDGDQIKGALNYVGPVGISVNAECNSFQMYGSGLFYGTLCNTDSSSLDHAVTLVGYGYEDDTEYFLLRNSWGTSWGENGYMKIVNNGNGNGVCGMFLMPIIPTTTNLASTLISGFTAVAVAALYFAF